ncbi:unnamed protein product, partial [Hapterophycus canaliculatus]
SILPDAGASCGGTRVSIVGRNFVSSVSLVCMFGDGNGNASTPARWHSREQLECVSPSWILPDGEDEVVVPFSVNTRREQHQLLLSSFRFVAPAVVGSISPETGQAEMWTNVSVTGAHLDGYGISCISGGQESPPTIQEYDHLECTVPPRAAPVDPSALVRVTADGIDFSTGSVVFTHNRTPYLLSIRPLKGSFRGGTSVFLSGAHIPNAEALACVFGALVVPARWLSRELVQCESPPRLETGNVNVQVSADGRMLTSEGLDFLFYKAKVLGVFPSVGPMQGDTMVSVSGEGFEQSEDIVVRFGLTHAQGTFVTSSEIQCLTPKQVNAGEVQVSISANGVDVDRGSDAVFTFTRLSLSSIDPSWGFREDQTVIILHGSGYANTSEIACSFGRNGGRSVATFKSTEMLSCAVPRGTAEGDYEVELTSSGRRVTSGGPTFSVEKKPTILSMFPTSGPSWGGEAIHVKGFNFKHTAELGCLFGSTAGNASWESSISLWCLSPPGIVGDSVRFTVTLKGRAFSSMRHMFMFWNSSTEECALAPTIPDRGSHDGNTTVLVSGTNFIDAESVECVFGASVVIGRWLSPALLACVSAPRDGQDRVSLGILINGVASSASSVFFYYKEHPTVCGIFPSLGSAQGGTVVSFRGEGFMFSSGLRARFGDTAVPVTFISSEELRCTCPPSVPGRVYVLVGDHDQTFRSNNETIFTYVEAPMVDGLYPSRGSVTGGLKVSVRGRNFANTTSLSCLIGQAGVVLATFVSPKEIECGTPAFAGHGPQELEITINGIDFTSDGNIFTYI